MAYISIPTVMVNYADNQKTFETQAKSVQEAFNDLTGTYPQIKERIFKEDANILDHVRVFLNDEDIDSIDGLNSVLNSRDEINIIVAMAGG